MDMLTLIPTTGHDYKDSRQVRRAWARGDKFVVADHFYPLICGREVSRSQVRSGSVVGIRFAKQGKLARIKV